MPDGFTFMICTRRARSLLAYNNGVAAVGGQSHLLDYSLNNTDELFIEAK